MMNADKLREAIEGTNLAIAHLNAFRWDDAVKTIRSIRWADVREAAEAHLATLPKTKEIEVWHCQWVSRSAGGDHLHLNVYPTEGGARDHAEFLEAGGNKSSSALHCVQVTGPHKMTVLA